MQNSFLTIRLPGEYCNEVKTMNLQQNLLDKIKLLSFIDGNYLIIYFKKNEYMKYNCLFFTKGIYGNVIICKLNKNKICSIDKNDIQYWQEKLDKTNKKGKRPCTQEELNILYPRININPIIRRPCTQSNLNVVKPPIIGMHNFMNGGSSYKM